MCGIAGYITTDAKSYRHKVAVAILAKNMEQRGGHAWGTMTDAGAGVRGLGSIDVGFTVPASMPLAFALHTRYATQGARTLENAHPFTIAGTAGTVVGIHNGIISNHRDLNQSYARTCAVDSQHIFSHIANGVTLNDLEGYGTIVYTLNGAWYIGRFNDGELTVALTDAGIFYASTKEAVIEALNYAGITWMKWLKVRNNTVYKLTSDGLTKAYKITAAETTRRWNDKQDDWLDRRYATGITTDIPADVLAGDEMPMQECDLCMDYVDDLWECGRGQFACGGCYWEVTGRVPHGYEDTFDRAYSRTQQHRIA